LGGCYLTAIGFGAPVEALSVELGKIRFKSNNLGAGIFFALFGLTLTYLAVEHFKKKETTATRTPATQSGGSGGGGVHVGTKIIHTKMDKNKDLT